MRIDKEKVSDDDISSEQSSIDGDEKSLKSFKSKSSAHESSQQNIGIARKDIISLDKPEKFPQKYLDSESDEEDYGDEDLESYGDEDEEKDSDRSRESDQGEDAVQIQLTEQPDGEKMRKRVKRKRKPRGLEGLLN